MAQLIPSLVIFLQLLDMTLTVSFRDVLRVALQFPLIARALLAVVVLVPAFATLLTFIEAIPWPTRVALALMACSPGAPMSAKRAVQLGSPLSTAMAMQLIVAGAGVLTAPVTLIFMAHLQGLRAYVPMEQVASQVFTVQVIPVALGCLLVYFFPGLRARLSRPLSVTANLSMLLLIVLTLAAVAGDILEIAAGSWLALLSLSVFSLAVGHLLGGPRPETRVALAVASANRNLGLAIFLSTLVRADPQKLIIVYALLNFLMSEIYKRLVHRRMARAGGNGASGAESASHEVPRNHPEDDLDQGQEDSPPVR